MKSFILLLLVINIFAQGLEKPPMPPMDLLTGDKKATADPCSLIPPMLFKLPPPLLKMVDRCNTKNLKPKKDFALKKLQKNGFTSIKKLKIEEIKNLPRFYKVSFEKSYFFDLVKLKKELYCDWRLNFCFTKRPKVLK